jgi:hypothetical protein
MQNATQLNKYTRDPHLKKNKKKPSTTPPTLFDPEEVTACGCGNHVPLPLGKASHRK